MSPALLVYWSTVKGAIICLINQVQPSFPASLMPYPSQCLRFSSPLAGIVHFINLLTFLLNSLLSHCHKWDKLSCNGLPQYVGTQNPLRSEISAVLLTRHVAYQAFIGQTLSPISRGLYVRLIRLPPRARKVAGLPRSPILNQRAEDLLLSCQKREAECQHHSMPVTDDVQTT